jgi:hypothetical protein
MDALEIRTPVPPVTDIFAVPVVVRFPSDVTPVPPLATGNAVPE